MKIKFGILFLIILTCIFIATGFYFLKQYAIFSSIFFIASLINMIFIYKEYDKDSKVVFNIENAPEELKIKHSISMGVINILIYMIFLMVAIFGVIISKDKLNMSNVSVLVVIVIFCGIFIVMLSLEIKKISGTFISINNEGIRFKDNQRMHWSKIEQEKVISKYIKSKDSRHDHRLEINYLYFFYDRDKVEVEISKFDIDGHELAQFLKIYRERYYRQHSLS